MSFTQDQVREYIKCKKDPIYFIEKYIKIVNVDRGLISFKLYPFQKKMIRALRKNRFVIGKLPRQVGKTQTVAAYMCWAVQFHDEQTIAILAHIESQAKEILARIKKSIENMPKWMQQGVTSWNKTSIELENGSRIKAAATGSDTVRGGSYNMIFLDEFAFVNDNIAHDFFNSVFPTISSGETTKLCIVSTPKGMNHFYKRWTDAEEGRSNFVPISINWNDVPGRDEKWREQQIAASSQELFAQEYMTEFLGSSDTLISGMALRNLAFKNPIRSNSEGLEIWEDPKTTSYLNKQINRREKKRNQYVIVCDVSRGVGLDYHAATVFDITTAPYKIVARYRNNLVAPMILPQVLLGLAKKYNDAYVLVETNDNGQSVADTLFSDHEYENVLYTRQKPGRGIIMDSAFSGRGSRIGVKTTAGIKNVGCSVLKSLIEDQKLIFWDSEIVSELATFVRKGKSFAAEPGRHDDMVMTLVLFAWMTTQPLFKELTDRDVRTDIYGERIQEMEDLMKPLGFSSEHQEVTIDSSGDVWRPVEDSYESLPDDHPWHRNRQYDSFYW